MRNLKVLGAMWSIAIIAMVAIIGLAMAGCKPEPADDPPSIPPPAKLRIVIGDKGPFTNEAQKIYCVIEQVAEVDEDGDPVIGNNEALVFGLFKLENGAYEFVEWIDDIDSDNLDTDSISTDTFKISDEGTYVIKASPEGNKTNTSIDPGTDDTIWTSPSPSIVIDDTDKDEIQAFFATNWKSTSFDTTRGDTKTNVTGITETIEISYVGFKVTNSIDYSTSTATTGITNSSGAKCEGIEWTINPYWTKITVPSSLGQDYTVGYKLSVTMVKNYGYTAFKSFNIYMDKTGGSVKMVRTNEGGSVINAGSTPAGTARTYTKQ